MAKQYEFSLYVTVHDEAELKEAAEARFLEENPDTALDQWRSLRDRDARGAVCADIQMLFDPGTSPPGVQIEDSSVEQVYGRKDDDLNVKT